MPTDTFGCVGNKIKLRSGRYFDFADPQPHQFVLTDIAGGLAKACRFSNQAPRFYSVAEHSILCRQVAEMHGCPRNVIRAVLMHDAAEAFTGDITKPLKVMLGEAFTEIERRIEDCIATKYDLDFSDPVIKDIDRAMLLFERQELWVQDYVEWAGQHDVKNFRAMPDKLRFLAHDRAEIAFIHAATELGIK